MSGVDIEAMGTRLRITVGPASSSAMSVAASAWRDACPPHVAANREAPTNAVPLLGTGAAALSQLSTDVTLAALEAQRGRMWLVHAAALALDDGRVVILVAPSGHGKTTASLRLGQEFGYVSDETAAIRPDGSVAPYRKPLSLIETPGAPKAQRAPSELGLRSLPNAPLRLARVVLLDRADDGPDLPEITAVPLSEALPDLVTQSSYLRDLPAPLATIAGHVERTGGVLRVRYREAATLLPIFPTLAADSASVSNEAPSTAPLSPDLLAEASAGEPSAEPRFSRATAVDGLRLDHGTRVALAHRSTDEGGLTIRVLDGIAPAIWEAATGASRAQLVAAVIDAHGDAPDGATNTLVDTALAGLVAEGVLIRHD